MASEAPTTPQLPLLYEGLEPISREKHGKMKLRRMDKVPAAGATHAVPLTVEEFGLAQRFYPIIFSGGDEPVPLALMGLNEGINTFLDKDGLPIQNDIYIPAYMRRYPFMLARLNEDSEEMSLCFDPTSETIGDFKDGEALFDDDGKPATPIKDLLRFCEQFEAAGRRTALFTQELKDMDLLMEGEVAIQPEGMDQPFVYRGFQMVNEEKFRELSGDKLRKMNQSGMLPIIMAHLFSLTLTREIFLRQVRQGTGPEGSKKVLEALQAR